MLEIGKVYNLITKYPISLGAQLNNLSLVGIDVFLEAVKIDNNVITQHENVLKEATSSDVIHVFDYRDFKYNHFKDENGISHLIPLEYISTYSVSGNDYTFKVKNVSQLDRNVIKELMITHGFIIEEVV